MTIDPDSTVASMFEAHFLSTRPKSLPGETVPTSLPESPSLVERGRDT